MCIWVRAAATEDPLSIGTGRLARVRHIAQQCRSVFSQLSQSLLTYVHRALRQLSVSQIIRYSQVFATTSEAEGSQEPNMADSFFSIYSHGFIRVAVCVPHVRVADPEFNTVRTAGLAAQASDAGAGVALFPELGISSYAIDDLLQQEAILDGVLAGIRQIAEASM